MWGIAPAIRRGSAVGLILVIGVGCTPRLQDVLPEEPAAVNSRDACPLSGLRENPGCYQDWLAVGPQRRAWIRDAVIGKINSHYGSMTVDSSAWPHVVWQFRLDCDETAEPGAYDCLSRLRAKVARGILVSGDRDVFIHLRARRRGDAIDVVDVSVTLTPDREPPR